MSIMTAPLGELEKLARSKEQALRLGSLLRLFVEDTDAQLSDRDLILAAFARWRRHQDEEIGDPSR